MALYCKECECELVLRKGEFVCDECERKWSEILLSDEKYYNEKITNEYNTIVAFEYGILKELLTSNQIYGLMFQIKDLYEVIVRIPVLITASLCIKKQKQTNEEKEFLWFLMSKPLSFGDWRASLSKASAILKADENADKKILNFVDSVKKFANSTKHGDIVFWRNESIAHGALKLLCDVELYEDISNRLSLLTEFLIDNSTYFKDIKLSIDGLLLQGNDIDFSKLSGELFLKFDDKQINLSPFYSVGDGGIFFYDKYTIKLKKTDIIEYLRGKKISLHIPELSDIAGAIDEKETSSLESTSYTIQERAICEKFLETKDYFEPKFITSWLENNIEENKKIMLLQMEEGMGKSTFVRAIDNLSLNLIELDEVAVRTFYINSTYNSRVDDFSVAVIDSLRKISPENVVANNIKEIDLLSENPQQAFADVLNHFKKYHYPDKKLLFVFDGIDELNVKPDRNITDFIPNANMLDDGVFVLITSRTELASDNISLYTRNYLNALNCEKLKVFENSMEYQEFAYEFFKNKVISNIKTIAKRNKLKDFNLLDEDIDLLFNKIQRKSILNLTFLKEIFSFNFEDFCKKEKSFENLAKIFDDNNIFENYLYGIRNITGNRYYEKFILVLCVLTLVSKPLSLDEIAYLSNNEAPNFAFLGFINSMRLFLSAKRTFNGSKFEIAHIEQRKAIKSLFKDVCSNYLLEIYNKIIEYLNTNANFLGKEKSYMALLESIFNYFESENKPKADELFLSLINLNYPSNWTKKQADMINENSVIKRVIDYYDSSKFTNDEEIELKMAGLIEPLALNYYILNRFELCDYYFTRVINTYKKFEKVLTDDQKFKFINALTHYATYKLYINENEEGADLYAYSLKFTEELYKNKSRRENGELYFSESYYLSELVCMSNLYRGCGKYDKVLETLDFVSSKLPNCAEDERKHKTFPFCYLGYGQVYELLNRYNDAADSYNKAIEKYKDCLKNNIEFFIPDCILCFVGAINSYLKMNDNENVINAIKQTDDFIKEMQNINKHISYDSIFNYLKVKTLAYKEINNLDKMRETKEYAIKLFEETLSEENKNSDILRKLLNEIRQIN